MPVKSAREEQSDALGLEVKKSWDVVCSRQEIFSPSGVGGSLLKSLRHLSSDCREEKRCLCEGITWGPKVVLKSHDEGCEGIGGLSSLKNRVVVVTGGASGIGEAIVEAFRDAGRAGRLSGCSGRCRGQAE